MTYRKISTSIWADPDFEALEPLQRYLFLYLWTNEHCNQAGVYEISLNRIAFETRLPVEQVCLLLKDLEPKVQWLADRRAVWVLRFLKRQCQNANFAKAALGIILANYPEIGASYVLENRTTFDRYGVKIPKSLL